MSNFDEWVIARTAITSDLADADLFPVVDDPAGTASTKKLSASDARRYFALVESNTQTGTAYTLVLADQGKTVTCNNAAAVTLTVPPNSSVAFPTGTVVGVEQLGAGTVTITAGAGVTLRSRGNLLALAGQYAAASLRKIGGDEWLAAGDLV